MASIPSGEPPNLDSRLRGNGGCSKVSFRGQDGGLCLPPDYGLVVIPAPGRNPGVPRGGSPNLGESSCSGLIGECLDARFRGQDGGLCLPPDYGLVVIPAPEPESTNPRGWQRSSQQL